MVRLFTLTTALVLFVVAISLSADLSGRPAHAASPPPGPFYLCYDISPPDPVPGPLRITLYDQFFPNGFGAEVRHEQLSLCSSATKNGDAGQDAKPIVCYNLVATETSPFVDFDLEVKTQYGTNELTFVRFRSLCVPAAKNADNIPQEPTYVCYTTQLVRRANIGVSVKGQFNAAAVDTSITSTVPFLCVRANKGRAGERPLPHLACYPISPVAPVPANPMVMVKTQFNMNGWNTQVGSAKTLCMPATKGAAVSTMGGVAEYPRVASGSRGAPLAATAAALAALACSGWYARRRWLK